jgi:hypothetical protein
MVCTCHPSYTGIVNRRITDYICPSIIKRPHLKNNKVKRSEGVAQEVECLLSSEFKSKHLLRETGDR